MLRIQSGAGYAHALLVLYRRGDTEEAVSVPHEEGRDAPREAGELIHLGKIVVEDNIPSFKGRKGFLTRGDEVSRINTHPLWQAGRKRGAQQARAFLQRTGVGAHHVHNLLVGELQLFNPAPLQAIAEPVGQQATYHKENDGDDHREGGIELARNAGSEPATNCIHVLLSVFVTSPQFLNGTPVPVLSTGVVAAVDSTGHA